MRIAADSFGPYAVARRSQLGLLEALAPDLYGRAITDWDAESLKTYQDLLAYAFIRDNVPAGSRLLEVGGGYSRVLGRLAAEYDCWNVDRFEGLGAGPTDEPKADYRIVRDYMGTFNRELPDDHFDLVFSISVLEHVSSDSAAEQEAVLRDIQRVTRPGGFNLHLVDAIAFQGYGWYHPIVGQAARLFALLPPPPDPAAMAADPGLYVMSREAYEAQWRPITGQPYEAFGRPTSLNLLWRRPDA